MGGRNGSWKVSRNFSFDSQLYLPPNMRGYALRIVFIALYCAHVAVAFNPTDPDGTTPFKRVLSQPNQSHNISLKLKLFPSKSHISSASPRPKNSYLHSCRIQIHLF
jgi:hypothetical protein